MRLSTNRATRYVVSMDVYLISWLGRGKEKGIYFYCA